MKKNAKVLLVLAMVLGFASASAQEWVWQNPYPTGNQLAVVTKSNKATLIAAGTESTIVQSKDRGESWTIVHSGTNAYLTDVCFVDSLYGYAAGSGYLLKTTDGGSTWMVVTQSVPYNPSFIHFIDRKIGFGVGSSSYIVKTTDGGKSWDVFNVGGITSLNFIAFADENHGFVVGNQRVIVTPRDTYLKGVIYKTTNGGQSWVTMSLSGFSQREMWGSMYFVNSKVGFMCNGSGTIVQTNDGGEHWTVNSAHPGQVFEYFHFFDENQGFAYGPDDILMTSDGGATWVPHVLYGGLDDHPLSICILDQQEWVAVGGYGQIVKTADSGLSWTAKSKGSSAWLYSIFFVNSMTGYAVGGDPIEPATILKTTNGGGSWTELDSDSSATLASVFFLDDLKGFVVGDWGCLMSTLDGGQTWNKIETGIIDELTGVYFPNRDTGYVCGTRGYWHDKGTLLKTTDGGNSWRIVSSDIVVGLNSMVFLDGHTGFAVGGDILIDGAILKTTDGGESWTKADIDLPYDALYSCSFPSKNVGFAAGDHAILKTTNGGVSWFKCPFNEFGSVRAVFFANEKTGYAAGLDGTIYKTIDGGNSWISFNLITINWISSLFFLDETTGWAAGQGGMILKTGNGTASGINNGSDPAISFQLFPNPATSTLNISLSDKALNGHLSIIDFTGRILQTIEITDTQFQTDISRLTPGVYFVQLKTAYGKAVQKIVRL
jgi:photosystem II stability/assembly factor-like uncharacterized protein